MGTQAGSFATLETMAIAFGFVAIGSLLVFIVTLAIGAIAALRRATSGRIGWFLAFLVVHFGLIVALCGVLDAWLARYA
jgi:hypothetical protein